MTRRRRLLALALLVGVVAVSSALAGRGDTGFTVTSTLDGKTVLPVRSQWIATPSRTPALDHRPSEQDLSSGEQVAVSGSAHLSAGRGSRAQPSRRAGGW